MEAVAYSKSPLMEKEFTLKINGDRLFLDPASPTERKSLGTINRTKALFDIPLEKYNHLPSIEIQVHFDNEFFTLTLLSSPKDAQKNSIVLSRKYRQQTVFLAEFDDVKLVSYDRKLLSIETESNPCQLDISLVNEPANATVSEILFEAQGKPQKLKVFISAD
jgi:hypothetical protein